MGGICSKSGTHSGSHQVLGSSTSHDASAPSASDAGPKPNARSAAAEAAERRLKQAQARGTHASNPKQGKLAAQAAKPVNPYSDNQRADDRLVWD